MEPLWSPVVATGGNQWQMRPTRMSRNQAKTVAAGCHRLPGAAHGKEGVSGSSPEEGSAKAPHVRAYGSAPQDSHLPSVVPGRHHCRWLDHQHDTAPEGMRPVHDAARDRHPVTGAEHERLATLYLELKPAL